MKHAPAAGLGALLFAGLVLCAEYLALSFSFDARPLIHQSGAVRWLGTLGKVAPAAVVTVAVLIALFGGQLHAAWTRANEGVVGLGRVPAALHVIAYGVLFVTSAHVFANGAQAPAPQWIVAWLVGVLAVVVSLAATLLPLRRILWLLREVAPVVASGVLIGAAVWVAGIASMELWDPLGAITLYAIAFILQWLVPDLVFDPARSEVGSARFYIQVDPVCSGYEGIGLIVVFLAVYFWSARRTLRYPAAWLLFPIAVVGVFVGNIVRITALIGVGLHVSPAVALGGFHSKAGWLLFCAIGLGIVAWSRRSSWFSTEPLSPNLRADNAVAPYLVPLLAVIAVALTTGLFSTGLDRGYALRVVAGVAALLIYQRQLSLWAWRASLEGVGVGVLVFALWLVLSPTPEPSLTADFRGALAGLSALERTGWIFFKLVGSIGVIPIVEERAFRGYLLRRVISSDFDAVPATQLTWPSVLVSSLAFGALHQEWVAGIVAGVLFAGLVARRGELGEAIFAHAVANALIAVWALGLGRMDLWM